MSKKVKILGIQMQSVFNEKIANYQKIAKILDENADFKPDFVVLPETFNAGYDAKNFEKNAEPIPNDATSMFLSGMAQKYNTNIAGSMIEKIHDGTMRNTLVVFNRDGALCGKYHKTHVFSHQGCNEGQYITAGDNLKILELDFGVVGLSICYDLRFPELYRSLALSGAQVVICPAAWPDVRLAHWQNLLRARAIENQFFMLGVNQVGKVTLSRTDAGHSALIDPWGETITECQNIEETLIAEIDLDKIDEVRNKIPVLRDRRDDIYEL